MGIIEQMKLAFAQPNLGQAEKAVLVALTFRAGRSGECWPSLSDIADMCSMSRATASRALTGLIAVGYVARRRRFSRSNAYKLQLPQIAMTANCDDCNVSRLLPQIETIAAANCDTEHTIGTDHENKPKRNGSRFTPDLSKVEGTKERREALEQWVAYKSQKRQPYVEIGWKTLLKKIANNTDHQVCTAISKAISNGYSGFFPDSESLEPVAQSNGKHLAAPAPISRPFNPEEWQ